MVRRIWQDGTGLALSAANLNAMEDDIELALTGTGEEKENFITPGTVSQYFRGDKTMQTLNAAAVGLGNVNNTTDALKPISNAAQAALDGKVSKGDYTVSVTDYAAVGDNVADDTAEFQAAINAAPAGGTVTIPPTGTFKISGQLNITKSLTIRSYGGSINFTGSGVPLFKVTASAVTIRDVKANGAGVGGLRVAGTNAVWATGALATPLTGLRVEDCTFTGFPDSGLWLEYCTRALVTGNHIIDVLYAGIMGLTMVDSTIGYNVVSNAVQKAPVVNTYGIALSDWDNTLSARSRNCLIIGNVIRDVPDWEGIDTHGGENITIIGNTVRRCGKGIAVVAGSETRVASPTSCTVVGNTVDAGTIETPVVGIFLAGVDATNLASANITGNTVIGYPAGAGLSRLYVDATKSMFGYNLGTGQRGAYSQATGNLTIGTVAPDGTATFAVTFPAGRFTSTPFISVSSDSTRISPAWADVSTTGFTFQASNWTASNSSSTTTGHWVATQV